MSWHIRCHFRGDRSRQASIGDRMQPRRRRIARKDGAALGFRYGYDRAGAAKSQRNDKAVPEPECQPVSVGKIRVRQIVDRDDGRCSREQRHCGRGVSGAKKQPAPGVPWQFELLPGMPLKMADLAQFDVAPYRWSH